MNIIPGPALNNISIGPALNNISIGSTLKLDSPMSMYNVVGLYKAYVEALDLPTL